MNGMATGSFTVIRGVGSTNAYGDEVDTQTDHASGLRGSVIEKTSKAYNPVDSRVVTIRTYTGRFRFGTDILDGDRLRDENTGTVYVVNSVNSPSSFANKPDMVLDLSVN